MSNHDFNYFIASSAYHLKICASGLALIFRPPPAASWPNGRATFARCRKANALARRTRLRRPRIGLSLTIAQPFMAGFMVWKCLKSRQGRKKTSAVPDGTLKF
jgi:hypothetical protein